MKWVAGRDRQRECDQGVNEFMGFKAGFLSLVTHSVGNGECFVVFSTKREIPERWLNEETD